MRKHSDPAAKQSAIRRSRVIVGPPRQARSDARAGRAPISHPNGMTGASASPQGSGAVVDQVERVLRRLALSDERSLRSALAEPGMAGHSALDPKTQALIRLGALLSVGAATVSLRWTVELACAAEATDEEILGVLLAIAPAVGHARVVGVAPHLGLALGYDFEDSDEHG